MSTTQQILVLPNEPIALINPLLHGHFAEHLGELVYPGIYVGEDSPIKNTGGIRDDVVATLKPLEIPVLRWPGGCFADDYHWRDGIGPVEQRPMRVNIHWGMADEPNHFGTHEFMAFCRAIGAEPYLAANLGSGSPHEARDWVEYCNFAGPSALANERHANGAADPFRVKYWGIGNENWGCGGHMAPDEYAGEFARYRTFVRNYSETKAEAIACGPPSEDWNWTRGIFDALQRRGRLHLMDGFAAHYYCWTAGTATEYSNDQWLELLAKAAAIEGIITGHRAIMDEYDPERRIKLFLDEWGAWHPEEKTRPSRILYQQNSIRDACVAALTLDTFHNHADKLFMGNIAQLINVLQAVLLVDGDRVVKTPTYHVFDMYRPHKGGQAVRFVSSADIVSDGGAQAQFCRNTYRDKRFPGLRAIQGSASVKDGALCVTVVNSHPTEPIEMALDIAGGRLDAAEVVVLNAGDIHAHNTYDQPDLVTPSPAKTVQVPAGGLVLPLPPASVVRIMGKLV